MEAYDVRYRTWYKGIPPRRIRLDVPGWGGEKNRHTTGDKPQPWHCPPFVDAATYGLELLYPFDTECRVVGTAGGVEFVGDFSREQAEVAESLPPFSSFAPGHFGMTSSLDVKVPPGLVLRTEPHPRFYTDPLGDVPCCVPGHIQSEWWTRVFFVVFKNPRPGSQVVFRKGEPYAQVLLVPRRVGYTISEMAEGEKAERMAQEQVVTRAAKSIARNDWNDHVGNNFDDKYKVLSGVASREGPTGVKAFLSRILGRRPPEPFRGRLVKVKKRRGRESVPDQEA